MPKTAQGDRERSKFLTSLKKEKQSLLIPTETQEPNTANNVIPAGSQIPEGNITQTVAEQNKILREMLQKRQFSQRAPSMGGNSTQASGVARSALEHNSRNPKLKSPDQEIFATPIKRTQSTIKKSHVSKAAYPNFVGMTPVPYTADDEFGMQT